MKKLTLVLLSFLLLSLQNCTNSESKNNNKVITNNYLDYSNKDDKLSGGVKMIPITTPKGEFKVWTKRVGNNPSMKVLLLHGGPGATHEYFEAFDYYFPMLKLNIIIMINWNQHLVTSLRTVAYGMWIGLLMK